MPWSLAGFGDERTLVAGCAAALAEYEEPEALSFTCPDGRMAGLPHGNGSSGYGER